MNTREAARARRSIRRFQDIPVPPEALKELADLARLYASGGNIQPLRCAVVSRKENTDRVFDCLKWAMYLPGFEIRPDNRPKAYLVLVADQNVKRNYQFDLGAAATTVMLSAQDFGLQSCCLAVVQKEALRQILSLPEDLVPEIAIALGYGAQESTAVPMTDSVKYIQDADGNLQVPKRMLEETLVFSDL